MGSCSSVPGRAGPQPSSQCFPGRDSSCGPCFDGCGWCGRQPRVRLTTRGRFVRRPKPCQSKFHPRCFPILGPFTNYYDVTLPGGATVNSKISGIAGALAGGGWWRR